MPQDRYKKFRVENLPQTRFSEYVPADGVEVKLLDGCNRSCSFCVNEDHIGKVMNPLDVPLFNRALAAWIESDEVEKPNAVYLTGGEPLMVMDALEAIIRPSAARGLATRVVTNGTLLNKSRVERLVDYGLDGVKVTFSTTDDARLASLVKGTREKKTLRLIENISQARAAGLWVFVRMGVGKHNADEMSAIYRLMKSIGVNVLQFKPWIPSGLAEVNQATLCLSPARLIAEFADFVSECYEDFDSSMEVTVSCYPPAREMGLDVKDCANIAKFYCAPDGNVTVCNFASEWLGNWKERDGLLNAVRPRRDLYSAMMDDHGVASCPARYNWSTPSPIVSPAGMKLPNEVGPTPVTLGTKP